ncbi:MAG: hypothetical protein K2X82_06950 [Gemmataceae bacterium]|nr:hypothetical protein [Gemmataceae bacterium]
MPVSIVGAVKIGLNRQFNRNSYVLFVGGGFANAQAVTITAGTMSWSGTVVLTDGTFALIRVSRQAVAVIEKEVTLTAAAAVTICAVVIADSGPVNVPIDLYDA